MRGWAVETVEHLPFGFVFYPRAYCGAFIGFKESNESSIRFCACQRHAIESRLLLWPRGVHSDKCNRTGLRVPDCDDFPDAFWRPLIERGVSTDEEIEASIQFEDKICHACNNRVPGARRKLQTRASPFTTAFAPYIYSKAFHCGIDLSSGCILEDRCCPELGSLLHIQPALRWPGDKQAFWDTLSERGEVWRRYQVAVSGMIQDFTRADFGFPIRGAKLSSETILYMVVKAAFPEATVTRHYRSKGLGGLSLDIFIHELSVGIEYQGDQHFHPLEHWGGDEALRRTIARDERKKALCDIAGIKLIHFQDDVLDVYEGDVRRKVTEALAPRMEKKKRKSR